MSKLDKLQYFLPRFLFLQTELGARCHIGDILQVLSHIEADDIDLASADFWQRWQQHMCALAKQYVERAKQYHVVALKHQALKSAAALFHFAEFMFFENDAHKKWMREQAKQCYWETFDHSRYELINEQFSVDNMPVQFYLIRPRGIDRQLPCVILSNGLDSMTEIEMTAIGEKFLLSGTAVCLFEGPGQGTQLGYHPLKVDMENVVEALRLKVLQYDWIDQDRLGFFGISFGGYIALRVAKYLGEHFKLIVNYGGGPEITPYNDLKRRLKADFKYAFQVGSDDESARINDQCRLDPFDSPCKLVSFHGEKDDIFPLKSLTLFDEYCQNHTLHVYPECRHVCLNLLDQITGKISDLFYNDLVLQREGSTV